MGAALNDATTVNDEDSIRVAEVLNRCAMKEPVRPSINRSKAS
jgi:hypothetical protein